VSSTVWHRIAALLPLLAAACGAADPSDAQGAAGAGGSPFADAGAAGADAAGANADAAGFAAAPHTPFPLVTFHGGSILAAVKLVPIYFPADPLRSDLQRYNDWIVGSNYWKAVTKEYGVGTGTTGPAVDIASAPPVQWDDPTLETWIKDRIADATLPVPTSDTLYTLFLPAATTLTFGTAKSCATFAGYHHFLDLGAGAAVARVAYAVIPRCSFTPGDELMIATNTASHEYVEAATTPFGSVKPGWILDGQDGTPLEPWQMLNGLCVSDLCENQSFDIVEGFRVQDMWSNQAAQTDHNPCQPSDPAHPFFMVSADATIYHAAAGATVKITAMSWSNMPAPDWTIGINWGWLPSSDFDGKAMLSRTTVNNGDAVTVTITVPQLTPPAGGRSVYRFTIDSIDPINPNFYHPWPVMVVVP
jgi:hypothetical protein